MLDMNYVQARLDQVKVDDFLPLRSWCRDLITEVRHLEARANDTTLVIKDFQDKVKELENDLKWSGSINEGEDQYCHGSKGDGECYWDKCPQVRDGEPMNTARDCPLDTDKDEDSA